MDSILRVRLALVFSVTRDNITYINSEGLGFSIHITRHFSISKRKCLIT